MCDVVTDRMKVFARPYVVILAGGDERNPNIGTGTFLDGNGVELLTCEHVARGDPSAYYLDETGSTQVRPGTWRADANVAIDAAIAPINSSEWACVLGRAEPLPFSRFAKSHTAVSRELLFFRGIAGENASFVGALSVIATVTGYCSQEMEGSGDARVFEMLWEPGRGTITLGTAGEVADKLKQDDPRGFSGSLVWNTRFVELGCDLERWRPEDAVVTGLLRRYDSSTHTLLTWRVEHLLKWLGTV